MKSKNPTNKQARRQRQVATGPAAELARHRAQCRICRHPQREEIEREFLDWTSAREIAEEYKLGSHRTVYRHANALDLFHVRRGYVERVLDNVLERSGEAKITAASVVSAIRLMLELNSYENQFQLEILREGTEQKSVKRAAKSGDAAGAAGDDDEDAYSRLWANASPQLRRALTPPPTAAPAQAPAAPPAVLGPEKTERNAAPMTNAPKEAPAKTEPPSPVAPAETKPPKPPAPANPSPAPAPVAPEPGTRREPDGPPQVAGMAWPWARGSSPFARRGRWRGRPVSG